MVVSYSIAGYPECHLEDFAKMWNSLNKSYCTLINLFHQQLHYASISKKKYTMPLGSFSSFRSINRHVYRM
jgi:hypothetical protein